MSQTLFRTILFAASACLFCFTPELCRNVSAFSDSNETTAKTVTKELRAAEASEANEPNEPSAEIKSVSPGITISGLNMGLQRHSIEIGPEIYSFTYKESGIKDEGIFYGGIFNYTYRGWVPDSPNEPIPESGGSLRAEFRFASGDADYDGALQNGTPYKVDDIGYDAYEARLLFGLDAPDESWLASIYTGVGYRYSTDDSSFDPAGYKRESNYIYIPIAYQLDGKFENNWAWGCKLEADFLARGIQKSDMSDVGDPDIENRQNTGYGLRASLRLQNKTNKGVLTIEPFVRYWNIDESEYKYIPPYYYYEPANSTTEVGLQLLWRF
ncbi:MAG: hypothetical protein JW787_18485 [Sedimentisphaerales bacterium]|nr:hypothetical protein [Sedimentisphaerales bacterium]